jgi:GNAT superfamily N-acetyltransferase
MSSVNIRLAGVPDAAGIAYVHVTAWRETYRGLIPDSVLDTLSIARGTERWKNTLDDSTDMYHLTLAAEVNGRVAGFANYGREHGGDSKYLGELFALYVLKDFHGQGIGWALVQRTAEELLKLEIPSMLVWVLAENPARKFYEHLGGVYLREKSIEIGESILMEQAYGWKDLRPLAGAKGLG